MESQVSPVLNCDLFCILEPDDKLFSADCEVKEMHFSLLRKNRQLLMCRASSGEKMLLERKLCPGQRCNKPLLRKISPSLEMSLQ